MFFFIKKSFRNNFYKENIPIHELLCILYSNVYISFYIYINFLLKCIEILILINYINIYTIYISIHMFSNINTFIFCKTEILVKKTHKIIEQIIFWFRIELTTYYHEYRA